MRKVYWFSRGMLRGAEVISETPGTFILKEEDWFRKGTFREHRRMKNVKEYFDTKPEAIRNEINRLGREKEALWRRVSGLETRISELKGWLNSEEGDDE
jgi:hypothetical protein